MKKCILATMVIGLALLCAAPVMALDVDFSGEFRLRGINHDNIALTDPKSASNAYYDSRARIKTTFKVNDNITFVTRFDALDNRKLGTQNSSSTSPNYQSYEDIQFDTAYTIIKTPYGAFIGGRIVGGLWGPSGMGDSNLQSKDRLMWYVPVDAWSFGGYAEKSSEQDSTGYDTKADADLDKYTAFVQNKGETFQWGMLFSMYDFKAFPSMKDFIRFKKTYNDYLTASSAATTARGTFSANYAGVAAAAGVGSAVADVANPAGTFGLFNLEQTAIISEGAAAAAGAAAQAGYPNVEAKAYVLDPYVSGNFGPFSYFGELIYAFGDADYENPSATQQAIDVDALQYHVEGKYKFGPAAIRGGYWYMSGDNNTDDNEMNAIGYIENNRDMDIALILTGDPHELGTYNILGGLGNFSADTQTLDPLTGTTAMAGAKVFYVGVGFDVMENLSIDVSYANAKVDKAPGTDYYDVTTGVNYTTQWDEEVGNEYDMIIKWTPMENLEYKIQGGYLDAGEYWKKGVATAQLDNMYTLYHALTISF